MLFTKIERARLENASKACSLQARFYRNKCINEWQNWKKLLSMGISRSIAAICITINAEMTESEQFINDTHFAQVTICPPLHAKEKQELRTLKKFTEHRYKICVFQAIIGVVENHKTNLLKCVTQSFKK